MRPAATMTRPVRTPDTAASGRSSAMARSIRPMPVLAISTPRTTMPIAATTIAIPCAPDSRALPTT